MKVLAVGAHPDDVEIGCGGSLKAHSMRGDDVYILIMTGGEQGGSDAKTRTKEAEEGAKILGAKEFTILGYKDTEVPHNADIVKVIEKFVTKYKPDRVYIPFWWEIHQDHRATSEAALSAARNVPQILMYEGPSTFPHFKVDYWVDIKETIQAKEDSIRAHKSQGSKEILKIEAVHSLNRFRGYQARTEFAEGFSVFRFIER